MIQGEIKEAKGFGKVRKKDKLVNNIVEINIQNKKPKNQKAKSPSYDVPRPEPIDRRRKTVEDKKGFHQDY